MMHEFKFGDIVRHKQTGAVFVVSDLEEDDGFIAAMEKDDAIVYSIDKTQIELIPHPDTNRLDWIIENSSHTSTIDGKSWIFGVDVPTEDHFSGDKDFIRATIDSEIRKLK